MERTEILLFFLLFLFYPTSNGEFMVDLGL